MTTTTDQLTATGKSIGAQLLSGFVFGFAATWGWILASWLHSKIA